MEAKGEIDRGPMKHNGRGSLELESSRCVALGVPIASTIAECMAVSAAENVNTPQG